jgi:hypothetical protein
MPKRLNYYPVMQFVSFIRKCRIFRKTRVLPNQAFFEYSRMLKAENSSKKGLATSFKKIEKQVM